ncbi:helix-turn-helix domain-containing protein [Streptomyces mirabilis]|nr:helix-turn-helix domain-containing protein [Streptomyces mirabilis]
MADSAEAVRPGDLVRATGLARSAVDRIAATLVHLGYLRAEGRDPYSPRASWSSATPTSTRAACPARCARAWSG